MAHLKAFRQRWLAVAAAQGGLGEAPPAQQPAAFAPEALQRPANGAALLPKKRLLESCGTGARQQQDSSLAVKKQRQAQAGAAKIDAAGGGPAATHLVQQQPKLDSGRPNAEGRPRPDGKPRSKPAMAAAGAAANPGKREGGAASGGDAGKASRAAAKDGAEKAPPKQTGAAGRPGKKEGATGERPGRKEAAFKANAAPADKPVRVKVQGEAAGRPAKPMAAVTKVPAPKPALVKQEQQQEHAGSNPSSAHCEGGPSAAGEQRHLQQATSPAQPTAALKAQPANGGEAGSTSIGTPVELLLAPAEAAQHMGELVVTMYSGHGELWEAVRSQFADQLPSDRRSRLVYQDVDGDWLLLQPEAPWHIFAQTVRKLVITLPNPAF